MSKSMKPVSSAKKMLENKNSFLKACVSYAKNEQKHTKVSSDFKKQFSENFRKNSQREAA